MFLVAFCLLLPLVQSQAVGRVNEDVWVEGKLGSKVNFFGRQDEGALVLKHCSTGGTWM